MFELLSQKLSSLLSPFTGSGCLTEQNSAALFTNVFEALIAADVPYQTAQKFIEQVRQEALGKKIFASLRPSEQLVKIFHDQIIKFLGAQAQELTFKTPAVVVMCGLQGAGKTSTIAKLAVYVRKKHKKGLIIAAASVDFCRPAAQEQLEILAQQVGITFYTPVSRETVAATQEIKERARQDKVDILFLDTAGRLHVDEQLLDELKQVVAYAKPTTVLLVLDSMTGQESLSVARSFCQQVPVSGAIMTKMDSDTRGGALFAFNYEIGKPIYGMATGEHSEDFELVRADRLATRILGMGDLASLLERAQEKVQQHEQDAMARAWSQGRMTLDDFAQQLGMVSRLGSLSGLAKYMPGMGAVSPEMLEKGEREMKKFKAIMSSMTRSERLNPGILDSSRKKRIARGAGVAMAEVNLLLERFEQSQQFVKLIRKMGGNKIFRSFL